MISNCAISQNGIIRGNIFDQETAEPIIFCNVYLEDTNYGTDTDLNGFFSIADVPAGTYNLIGTYIGYDTLSVSITLTANNIAYNRLEMSSSSVKLNTVNISASRQQARTEVQISKLSISQKQIQALPSAGGEPDVIQYLQSLPGVISTGDQGGQLYIRGGSPIQNRILLDGLTIFNPFHSIGFYSVFETELIRNVDVYTGGFGAEYGGRISAIVDIKTREGNKKRFGGTLSASPFMVKGLIEGPIIKLNEKGSSASFVLTTKRSIISETAPSLYNYAARNDTVVLPFDIRDTYGKLSFNAANGSSFNVFGFNFKDRYNDPTLANIGWETTGGGLNFNLVPSNSSMVVDGAIGYSNYDISLEEGEGSAPRKSSLSSFNAALDFSFFGLNNEIGYGFDITGVRTDFEFTNPFGLLFSEAQNTTEFSAYMKYRQVFGKLILEPSFRLQYYASLGEFSPEPRLGIKYNVTDNTRIKLAGGYYSQNLISTSNERDVVNLFTGFLSGPDSQVFGLDGNPISSKLQKAAHAVAGVEVDITDNLTINLEGYFKDLSQLIIVNRNKTDASQSDYAVETGEAYGIDLSLSYAMKNFSFNTNYSYGFVNRFDGEQTFPTVFDRRHNLNLISSYIFGNEQDWTFSLRWNLGSGFPFTRTQGFYYYNAFLDGVGTDFLTGNSDDVGIIFDEERNGGRLPYYHRLDLSLQKTITFSKYASVDIILSATNTYDRENIFYFDRIKFDRVNQLPIIPGLAIKFKF